MPKKISHYYGDVVRKLFILAAVVMIGGLPFFINQIDQPLPVALVAIILIGAAAGLTSPRHSWTAVMNVIVAVSGVVIFERYAVDWHSSYGVADNFFWINQLLAVIFLFALYFSLKTLRRVGHINVTESSEGIPEHSFLGNHSDGGDGR